jgi:hypothetical protein
MEHCFRYLSRNDVAGLGIGMAEIIAAVEDAFLQKALGEVEMPPKPGITSGPGRPRASSGSPATRATRIWACRIFPGC